MLTNVQAETGTPGFAGGTSHAERMVMVREALLEPPADFLIPDFADGVGCALAGERNVGFRDTTYFDTADLRLAEHGITVRREHGIAGYRWTLVVTTDPGAPFPVRRRLRYDEPTPTVPSSLASYLRNHHRPVGIRPQAFVSGRADVLPLRMRGGQIPVGEIVNEGLETRNMSERVRTVRQITVVAFDLDGVALRLLEDTTSRLLDAGCRLEFVRGDLYRFIDPPTINEAAGG